MSQAFTFLQPLPLRSPMIPAIPGWVYMTGIQSYLLLSNRNYKKDWERGFLAFLFFLWEWSLTLPPTEVHKIEELTDYTKGSQTHRTITEFTITEIEWNKKRAKDRILEPDQQLQSRERDFGKYHRKNNGDVLRVRTAGSHESQGRRDLQRLAFSKVSKNSNKIELLKISCTD